MSALPPEAGIRQLIEHVCFVPEADIADRQPPRLRETTLRAVSLGGAPPISVRKLRLRLRPYG